MGGRVFFRHGILLLVVLTLLPFASLAVRVTHLSQAIAHAKRPQRHQREGHDAYVPGASKGHLLPGRGNVAMVVARDIQRQRKIQCPTKNRKPSFFELK